MVRRVTQKSSRVWKLGTSVQEESMVESASLSTPCEGSSQTEQSVASLSLGELLDTVGQRMRLEMARGAADNQAN